MTELSLIDQSVWQDLGDLAPEDGRSAFLTELKDMFRDLAPKLIIDLRTAAAAKDMTALRHTAHKLKGCAANLGGAKLAALCEVVEQTAAQGQSSQDPQIVESIHRAYEQTLAELDRLCQAA